jgi:hypothetical protein
VECKTIEIGDKILLLFLKYETNPPEGARRRER